MLPEVAPVSKIQNQEYRLALQNISTAIASHVHDECMELVYTPRELKTQHQSSKKSRGTDYVFRLVSTAKQRFTTI